MKTLRHLNLIWKNAVAAILLCLALAHTGGAQTDQQLYRRGVQDYLNGFYNDALVRLDSAVTIDSGNALIHNALGMVHLKLRHFHGAERHFRRAIETVSYTHLTLPTN